MNSFQAVKEAKLPTSTPGRITIEVVRNGKQLDLDTPLISGFRIIDNGIGLDDSNYDSFNTAFSPHKLSRGGKGLGRFTWLKAFEHAKIESTFKDESGLHTRSFIFDENYDADDTRGLPKTAKQSQPGTTVELIELKRLYHDQCPPIDRSLHSEANRAFHSRLPRPGLSGGNGGRPRPTAPHQ